MIKDLYSEIDRLKQGRVTILRDFKLLEWFLLITLFSEVYAAREKNGIYIPRDRYLQEEAEKKVKYNRYIGYY